MGAAEVKRTRIAAQCHDHTARLAGVSFTDFYSDAEAFTRAQLLVTEYYGFDAPNDTWDTYNIEAEAMGQKMVYSESAMPDIDRLHPLISIPSDLDRIVIPDPLSSGRMPYVHQINRLYMGQTGRPARLYFCAPFSLALNIRGYVNFIKDVKTDPAFVHRMMEFLCDEILVPYIRAMREAIDQPEYIAFGVDAWASPPNLSLDMFDEYVIPYTERIRERAGGTVVTLGQWGETKSHDPDRFLNQKLRTCPIFVNVLDPDLHQMGPQRVKAFADERNLLISAGIDAALIMDGPEENIVNRIREYIDAMGRDGKLILYLNQIPIDTPSEHVHAAVAAVRAFGSLPVPDDLHAVNVETPYRESFEEFLQKKEGTNHV